jgi:NAD(P)-dependent dehydrogenase (short-subunit alcohol dehydrogenase family)
VNTVSPGFLYTELVHNALKARGRIRAKHWEEYEARQGRRATPAEVGDAVALLSAPGMSLVNAHNFVLDKCISAPYPTYINRVT